MKTKPNRGKGYTAGNSCITEVVIDNKPTKLLLDPGAFCSCVGKSFLETCAPNFEDQLIPIDGIKLNSASNPMKALGIFETTVIFPHINGNLRITVEFVVIENCSSTHFMLGNDYLIMYGIDLNNNKDIYFTIGDNKSQKFSFLPFKRQITVIRIASVNLELERLKSEQRPAYPASPKSRESLEIHIKELLDLGVTRKVGHNEELEITTPVIVARHNGKSTISGDFRALNTYTVPDRYPIPKIQISLTQICQAVYISTMDALKGFNQNMVTPRAREYLRIIVHCGVYEYLTMPFGIKNAPSHFQRMMNENFPEELSEGCLIIYIDDIIVCSKTWEEHMYRLSRVLTKIQSGNMKISMKKCHFGFKEPKELGHVVCGLSLVIDNNKVAAVLLKPMPQNKK
ncbi:hypothetical protein O181_083514 [Austropuccinia psidii MF-1]|uniref:Reverse transcriptase domain-containing protein n=1 Tax=Austropuccinia psidii MF-1 TaxID=1389203 RepID=A0A9Q3FRQ8_9BASI|nr:hypothetical protein [Austropuccinia psidii MF-1]